MLYLTEILPAVTSSVLDKIGFKIDIWHTADPHETNGVLGFVQVVLDG